MYSLNKHRNF